MFNLLKLKLKLYRCKQQSVPEEKDTETDTKLSAGLLVIEFIID